MLGARIGGRRRRRRDRGGRHARAAGQVRGDARPVRPRPSSRRCTSGCSTPARPHVVSVHLSAALSGTWESAVLAAQDFPHGAVRVVDSRSTAMGARATRSWPRRGARPTGGAAADGAGCGHRHRRPHPHAVLRRHPRVPAPRWPDRVGGGAVRRRRCRSSRCCRWSRARSCRSRRCGRRPGRGPADRPDRGGGRGRAVDLAVHHLAAAEKRAAAGRPLRSAIPRVRDARRGRAGRGDRRAPRAGRARNGARPPLTRCSPAADRPGT